MTLKLFIYLAILLLAILGYRHYAATGRASLEVGDAAPDFTLQDAQGKTRALADYAGKYLVIYFYPKDDTPGCTQEACNFRDHMSQFEGLGVKVVGISVDDSASHQRFGEKYQLSFPLLADVDGNVASRYGVLTDLWVIKIAKRDTFIINPAGQIAHRYQAVDPKTHAQLIITDLKQLLHRD